MAGEKQNQLTLLTDGFKSNRAVRWSRLRPYLKNKKGGPDERK